MNVATNITSGTLYVVWLNATAQFWNGTAFENFASGNWGNYDVAVTVVGGNMDLTPPTNATDYQVRLQAGGSPATTDVIVAAGVVPTSSSGLDAPGVRSALGLNSPNLDTQLNAIGQSASSAASSASAAKTNTDTLVAREPQAQ